MGLASWCAACVARQRRSTRQPSIDERRTAKSAILAIAANAAVMHPHSEVVYEPSAGGEFVALRTAAETPCVSRRLVDVDGVFDVIKAFAEHPREERLLRAVENYGEALRRTEPTTASVHAILHLWMSVEALTVVIADRAQAEAGADSLGALGASLGGPARKGEASPRSTDVYGALRRRFIFAGDDSAHDGLRAASDGIEHGYMNFGAARGAVEEAFDRAARHVRHSILREAGVSNECFQRLTTGIYDKPLPMWRPRAVATGTWAADSKFDFEQPVHVRMTMSFDLEAVDEAEHATVANVKTEIATLDGLKHSLRQIGLAAPGDIADAEATPHQTMPDA